MNKNTSVRSAAAKKAAKTVARRRAFINRFGQESFNAVVAIVNGRYTGFNKNSLAAYKANLTRGTYSDFISKSAQGYRDTMALARL